MEGRYGCGNGARKVSQGEREEKEERNGGRRGRMNERGEKEGRAGEAAFLTIATRSLTLTLSHGSGDSGR